MRIEAIRDSHGALHAEIHAIHPASKPILEQTGEWTVADGTSLAREGLHTVLSTPWNPTRLVCRSDTARTVLARCLASFAPTNDTEHAITGAASRHGLLVPAAHGLPTQEPDSVHRPRWRNADARFWNAFACEQTSARGATRPYATWRSLPPRIETTLDETPPGIALERADDAPRAIARSADSFDDASLALGTLGRWLARFMQHRQVRRTRTPTQPEEATRRGFPEAGALGTTMLWIASRRIETIGETLWRYDADRHRLVPTSAPSGALVCEAMHAHKPWGNTSLRSLPAGIGIVTVHMARLAAQYDHLALALAIQNAGVCMAAAAVAGKAEKIGVRIYGRINGEMFAQATKIPPQQEAAIGAFGFGTRSAGQRMQWRQRHQYGPNRQNLSG